MSDQNNEPIEGAAAKMARESREQLQSILDRIDGTHQVIVILKDLAGMSPTHVHIEGPSKDKVLLYGMLGVAEDCVRLGGK